jgi:glycosyltransferase involved in cell wall biosynthesis
MGGRERVSIGIVAWNEEAGIARTLESLLQQSLYKRLGEDGGVCEIMVLVNGCTDRTAEVAREFFARELLPHPDRHSITASVVELTERGKLNAWNQFVHRLSSRESGVLFLMDSDIIIHRPDTLWNMLMVLRNDPEAHVATDLPRKDLAFKSRKSLLERTSLGASRLTQSAEAQLCGQLYCIRSEIARKIYMPKDLTACEDGFIKTLVCTDFLTRPSAPGRVRLAEDAEHTFEAYTSPLALLKNQKRQIIGQTIVHILIDRYLKEQPLSEKLRLAEFLREKDRTDPAWLKRLIAEHVRQKRFWWRLYPGMGTVGFRRLRHCSVSRRVVCLPAALAHSALVMMSGSLAYGSLKAGCTDYWPRAVRAGFAPAQSSP